MSRLGIVAPVHPVAFHLGSLTVTWYGILVAAAFLAGLWTASRRAPLAGIKPEAVLDLGPWLIVGAIGGSRIWYVATFWDEQFAGQPWTEVLSVWRGGLVFYGGLVGAALTTIGYAAVKRLPLWKLADVLAPSIALGAVFGRLGCLFNGCCYGRACALPWAIHYPQPHETHPAGVHPSQLYDSMLNLVLYLGLAWLYRRRRFDGQVFATHLLGYAVLRFVVEVFRGDYPTRQLLFGWLTPAQGTSIAILCAGLLLFWLLRRPSAATR